jgi:hypothetical protein
MDNSDFSFPMSLVLTSLTFMAAGKARSAG